MLLVLVGNATSSTSFVTEQEGLTWLWLACINSPHLCEYPGLPCVCAGTQARAAASVRTLLHRCNPTTTISTVVDDAARNIVRELSPRRNTPVIFLPPSSFLVTRFFNAEVSCRIRIQEIIGLDFWGYRSLIGSGTIGR